MNIWVVILSSLTTTLHGKTSHSDRHRDLPCLAGAILSSENFNGLGSFPQDYDLDTRSPPSPANCSAIGESDSEGGDPDCLFEDVWWSSVLTDPSLPPLLAGVVPAVSSVPGTVTWSPALYTGVRTAVWPLSTPASAALTQTSVTTG